MDYSVFGKLETLKIGRGRKSSVKYVNAVSAFDIETTNLDEIQQSIMYIWQFQLEDFPKELLSQNPTYL